MDLKYIMQKSRYKFLQDNKAILYDTAKLPEYKKELSMYIKELYIYNISLKSLAKENPRPTVKDELLNLAIICTENSNIKKLIKLKRCLPYKELCSLSGKTQKYFERWGNHILAFFILFNYNTISSFLNIKEIDPINRNRNDENSSPISSEDTFSGIVLKVKSKHCYILTPNGSFIAVSLHDNVSFGELYSGTIKKERDYFKVPAKIFIVILIVTSVIAFYMYNQKDRTVIIKGGLSITLETNKWNRVINLKALNSTSYKVKESVKTFNKPLDAALLSLLDAALLGDYISEDTSATIYISGSDSTYPNVENTKRYIADKNLPITINYNGIDLSSK